MIDDTVHGIPRSPPVAAVPMKDAPAEQESAGPSVRKPYRAPVLVELGQFHTLTRDFFPAGMGDLTNFFTGEEPLHDETS